MRSATRCAGMTERARWETRSGLSRSGVAGHAGIVLSLLAATIPLRAGAQQLSPQEVFRRVAPSVVVVEALDGNDRVVATGSGVVIPNRDEKLSLIATNCHVTDQADIFVRIKQGDTLGFGFVTNKDAVRDLCLVEAAVRGEYDEKLREYSIKKLPVVQVASSQWLQVGDKVYAVGAPQGLELSLSDGLVSGFRDYKGAEYIQTTAPISKGSSGGGLFDAQGRLVGITTMFLKDAQALNFAVPAELIASVPAVSASAARTTGASGAQPTSASRTSDGNSRWIYVGRAGDDGVVSIDRKTVRRSGSDVTVWWKTEYESPQTDSAGDTFDEESSLTTFHCSKREFSKLSFEQRLSGEVIYSRDRRSYELKRANVKPDTIGEAILEAACEL